MLIKTDWFVEVISSTTHVLAADGIRMPFFTQQSIISLA